MITTARADSAELLHWYDRHHRAMPWRVGPADRQAGIRPDPYRVWLSEVMLQQTTVATVTAYFLKFTKAWPDVHALAAAPSEDILAAWAGLGYYARARNLIKCAGVVSRDLGGVFPTTEAGLRELPGIGPYTAAAIAAIAFNRPAAVVDGNVERVMARIYAEDAPLPGVKDKLKAHAAGLTPDCRPGDYAQAVMDLGATICTPRRPACGICPWTDGCLGRATGIADTLPRKIPKAAKPIRQGIAWAAVTEAGDILTVRRPEQGLLGGMLAVPSTDWAEAPPIGAPPIAADWREVGEIRHTFTHFHLRLAVRLAVVEKAETGFEPLREAASAMPTVFAKVCRLVTGQIGV
ncbi:MAG: A/G-specific adenine glycosylase [Pseudomonadota bacterium]